MFPNSILYIGFVVVTSMLYWTIPQRSRVLALIVFGIAFYAYAGFTYLALILLLSAFTYGMSLLLHRKKSRFTLWFTVTVLIAILAFFKYAQLWKAPADSSSLFLSIGLPLGISFFTFEFIHYVVDVYHGKITEKNPLSFFSFAFFFPSLISGPIKRYERFSEQVKTLPWRPHYFYWGMLFLLLGYAQKIIIADPLIPFTKTVQHPEQLTGSMHALMGLYAYSIRIYADFAGLTNIAIGTALLFGIELPKNFDAPYLSPNIGVFWRKWHMSLSGWIRDYVYIPLGGNRHGALRTELNLLLVMILVGMWHGPTANFPVWGAYHGLGLAIHRGWSATLGRRIPDRLWTRLIGIVITFHFVTLGWALFLTHSLSDSLKIFSVLFHVS